MHTGVNVLGVSISAIGMADAESCVDRWVVERTPHYVTLTPAHSVMAAYQDPQLRRILNASGLTSPDGMAIVWLLRIQGHRRVERVYGPDLVLSVCGRGLERGYRHFLYGGQVGTAELLGQHLVDRFPGILIVGTYSPPFRPLTEEEDQAAVEMINSTRPDIVWVGLSTTRQERWMAEHLGRVAAPVMIGVGAAFDFLSGRKPQAPRWIQRSGLEWLFRLATEPRRLWPRYRQYPLFVLLATAQLLGLKHFPVDNS